MCANTCRRAARHAGWHSGCTIDASFDVVHASNPPDLLLPAVWSLKRSGSRFVFDHHDLAPEVYLSRFGRGRDLIYRVLRALERLSFHMADVVMSTNETYRRIAIERGGKADERRLRRSERARTPSDSGLPGRTQL